MLLYFCSRVALIPNLDQSHVIFIFDVMSKNVREMFSLTIGLILSNWFLWVTVKTQMEFFFTNPFNWLVSSDSCRINLLRYAVMSKKCSRSYLDLGKGMPLIALTFSESGEIPFPDFMCLKNISVVAAKTHMPWFCLKPDFWILLNTSLV